MLPRSPKYERHKSLYTVPACKSREIKHNCSSLSNSIREKKTSDCGYGYVIYEDFKSYPFVECEQHKNATLVCLCSWSLSIY